MSCEKNAKRLTSYIVIAIIREVTRKREETFVSHTEYVKRSHSAWLTKKITKPNRTG